MSSDKKLSHSCLLLLVVLCATITGLLAEENKNTTAEREENMNNTVPISNTTILITTASPDYKEEPSSVAQPRKITQSQKTTRERIPFITEEIDYDNYEDDDNSYKKHFTLPPHVSYEPCPFNRCKHLELPCSDIQKSTGGKCLCPGISGHTILPDAPHLNIITPGQTVINVSWCAPLSTVLEYRVLYGTPEGPLEKGPLLNESYRFFSIPNLVPGTAYRVCVVAINDAGESQAETRDGEDEYSGQGGIKGPCGTYKTNYPYGSYVYLAAGIGLAILACLLGIFVFVYWFGCRKRNRKLKRAVGEEMGVTNMSFKAESVENL